MEIAVKVNCQLPPGENIREIGSDIAEGSVVLPVGTVLHAAEMGLLASVGVSALSVHRRPVIGVLSTGDELVDVTCSTDSLSALPGKIRDSNRIMILAAAAKLGAIVKDLGVQQDTYDNIKGVFLREKEMCDIIITTGGVSMGERDFIKPLLEELGDVRFGRLCMKPGKPTTFAVLQRAGGSCLAFGLPGNPVSAIVTFHLLVVPALKRMLGMQRDRCLYPKVTVRLQHRFKLDPERPEYHRFVFLCVL